MGVVHKPNPDWASHIPVLIEALGLTTGPVLELGMGAMSTPLLHVLCAAQNRELMSYDNDGQFIELFKNFQSPGHNIGLVGDWGGLRLDSSYWSVVLVDLKPAIRRKEEIKKVLNADYIIAHDSQEPSEEYYGYDEIYPLFEYRYDYKKFKTWTTVLSNKHELDFLHSTLG